MDDSVHGAENRVIELLKDYGSAIVAFSGGVDSGLLAVLATEALPGRTLCVTINSPLFPNRARGEAKRMAEEHHFPHEVIRLDLLAVREIAENPRNRCFFCKSEIFRALTTRARELGYREVIDGQNLSDLGEFRPGLTAGDAAGIRHPFIAAGIDKGTVREIARQRGLPFWDKPSDACLASRFPYGEPLDAKRLEMVGEAEAFLTDAGFSPVRVRYHGQVARIEVREQDMDHMIALREQVVRKMNALGFVYVTLDLKGFRSGSMDEVQ